LGEPVLLQKSALRGQRSAAAGRVENRPGFPGHCRNPQRLSLTLARRHLLNAEERRAGIN
jgi:hypothetical protein